MKSQTTAKAIHLESKVEVEIDKTKGGVHQLILVPQPKTSAWSGIEELGEDIFA